MRNRLLISVLGNRNSGKSHTWNELFGKRVRRGKNPRALPLRAKECANVFLVSGSFEERGENASYILDDVDCDIVLCSMQYTETVRETLNYFIEHKFHLYVQWLNPGYRDSDGIEDRLDLVNDVLAASSVFSIRDGKAVAAVRVQEIREFIYGWAKYRGLLFTC